MGSVADRFTAGAPTNPRDDDRSRLPLPVAAIRLGVPLGVLEHAARNGALRVVYLGPARVPCTAPAWIGDWAAGRVR